MNRVRLIPELNYWIKIVLENSPVREKFFKLPVPINDSWRARGTVLDLLFNETFLGLPHDSSSSSARPFEYNSSSSSSSCYFNKPYIYCYRKINNTLVADKNILQRITLYAGYTDIYAPVLEQFDNLFNLATIPASPNQYYSMSELEAKVKNISYDGEIYFSTNYHLWTDAEPFRQDGDIPSAIVDSENIFNFTDEELMMLDKLYEYKMCNIPDPENTDLLDYIVFENLISPLSKLIYIYLDFELNRNYANYMDLEPFTDGSNLLHSIYEKHVLDHIYRMKATEFAVSYKGKVLIGNEVTDKCGTADFTDLISTKRNCIFLNQEQIENKSIFFDEEEIPYNEQVIHLFKNGIELENERDFSYDLDESDPEHPVSKIYWTDNNLFSIGEKVLYIWSYASLRSFVNDLEE